MRYNIEDFISKIREMALQTGAKEIIFDGCGTDLRCEISDGEYPEGNKVVVIEIRPL